MVRKAFKLAESEKPGPTHLELPENIAAMTTHELYAAMIPPIRARRSSPDRQSLRRAADLIEAAAFPVILAGHGVVRKGANDQLRRFAELLCIPVVTTFMGKGAISARSPSCIGSIGLSNDRQIDDVFSRADLIIAVGYGLVEYAPKNWNPTLNKRIVHIDFTSSEVDLHYVPEVEIVSDIRESVELLEGMLSTNKKSQCAIDLHAGFRDEFERARRFRYSGLGRGNVQILGGKILPGLRQQHLHPFQRLRVHGIFPPCGHGRQAGAS
jgi:acetolactate synthase-1/2/3 large subunit